MATTPPPTPVVKSSIGDRLRNSLPFRRVRTATGNRLKVFVGRLVVWSLLVLSLLWFATVTGIYFFVKYSRDFTDVRFSHVAGLPFTLPTYRRAQGEFFLKEGRRLFAEKDYLTAFELMRAGLRTVPEDQEARRFIAELYLAINRGDLAATVLEEGLPFHSHDPDFLQFFFDSLLRVQEDTRVIAAAEKLLTDGALPETPRYQAIMAAATASFLRARYGEAERWLQRPEAENTEEGGLLRARIFLDQGDQKKALTQLDLLTQKYPDSRTVYSTHFSLLRQLGRIDEARRLAFLASLRSPEDSRFALDLIQLALAARDNKTFEPAFDAFLERFGTNPEALNQLSAICALNGAADSARRVYDLVRERSYPWASVGVGLVESLVVAGQHSEALDTIQRIEKEAPDWLSTHGPALDALQAIALFAAGNAEKAEICLLRYLDNRAIKADQMVLCAMRLEALHGEKLARLALVRAVERDPLNQAALERLLLLDLRRREADALPRNVPRLLALRRPPAALLSSILSQLESDIYVFLPGREELISSLTAALQRRGHN